MMKKDVECQIHTWMIKKAKKAIVYKTWKDRGKGGEEKKKRKRKIKSLGLVKRDFLLHSRLVSLIFLH